MFSVATRSRSSETIRAGRSPPRPRPSPRRAASARFSATVMFGAVPLNGFWKTRPISFARRCSGQREMSWPAMDIAPRSSGNVPATALRSVDFPDPFVPMTVTKDPSSIVSETPLSARTSFGVPAKKVFSTSRNCSMFSPLHSRQELRQELRQHERAEDEERRHELQVVRIEAPSQRQGDDQPEEDRSHDGDGAL